MFEAVFDLSIKYKIPSLRVRYNRKIFCGLKKKRNELVNDWFNRVQDRINRCEFEKFTEVLLIDKFFCELSDDEIKPYLDTDTWSLKQLDEYFSSQSSQIIIDTERTNTHIANDGNVDCRQQLPSQIVKNEVPDKEYIQNESSIGVVDEANSFVDEIEMVQKEETGGFSALHTPTANDVGDENELLDNDFDSSDEVFLDTIKYEQENITFDDPLGFEPHEDKNANAERKNGSTTSAGNKSLICDLCTHLTFSQPYELLRHRKTVHKGINSFLCELCGKGFAKRHLRNRHLLVHSKEKRYHCDICNMGFTYLENLKQHNGAHHQIAVSYECKVCSKMFPKSIEMRKHMKQAHYTPEVCHPCPFCSKSFKFASGLKLHLVSHEKVKQFPCDLCKKQLKTLRNMNEHRKSAHPEAYS